MRTTSCHRSLWLMDIDGDASAAPCLQGDVRAEVAIVGGGYVGLWTALQIKEREPTCDVAVLEQDICGGGASGRNGGFVLSWWPKLASLIHLGGEEEAIRIAQASDGAIDEIRSFCERHSIDAQFTPGGWLWTATTRAQLGAWESVVNLTERFALDVFERLSPGDVAERSGSDRHLAGVYEPHAATVQPVALARGLRRVALDCGVRIYEGTRVSSFSRSEPVVLRTESGSLTADRLVIATNAWAAGIPELRRRLVVISSDVIATASIPTRMHQLGWRNGECIADSQMMVHYYRTTQDGRIVFGKGGWGIALGGRIGRRFDRDAGRARAVIADFRRIYPMLDDVPIEYDWCGPIDRTQDSLPILGHLGGKTHIVYGVGWSGNGVGPSVIGGKILASLALGLEDVWSASPLVNRHVRGFPPEPVRFLGAHVVREAVVRKERAEAAEHTPHPLTVRLATLAPAGIEDK